MRWLVGWSSATAGPVSAAAARPAPQTAARRRPTPVGRPGSAVGGRRLAPRRGPGRHGGPAAAPGARTAAPADTATGSVLRRRQRVRQRLRATADAERARPQRRRRILARLAVLGCCGATDDELRLGLLAARGGALRHLTAWPGSYTAVVQIGRRITVIGDLAGARPVFYTPWAGGTAYATAALPLADLIEAQLDIGHLAALLACPDVPEALGDGTPYVGRAPHPAGPRADPARRLARDHRVRADRLARRRPRPAGPAAAGGVRDALVDGVRAAARSHRGTRPRPCRRTPARSPAWARPSGAPPAGARPPASAPTSPAAPPPPPSRCSPPDCPACPARCSGHGTRRGRAAARRHLQRPHRRRTPGREAELERAGDGRQPAAAPRGRRRRRRGACRTPTSTAARPLTDEPGPSLIVAERHRRRLAAGSADHFIGYGARQVLDAHPARLADLLMDRRRRHLRPARRRAHPRGRRRAGHSAVLVRSPCPTVYRAARRLARTPYRTGVEDAAVRAARPTTSTAPRRRPARRLPRRAGLGPARPRRPLADRGGARRSIGSPPGRRGRPPWSVAAPRRAPAPGGPRPPRRRPPRPGTGRRGPQPAAARPLPRQPGRPRRAAPCPDALRVQPGARADDPAHVLLGVRGPRSAARLGRPLPRLLGGGRPGRPARRRRTADRPLRRARCSRTRAWSRPASYAAPCTRRRPRPRAPRPSRWTAWRTWSRRSCGCGGCWPAAARAGPARTRPSSARSPPGVQRLTLDSAVGLRRFPGPTGRRCAR